MLRGKQVLPEGNARLGSRNMKACPTQTCVMDMGLGLLSCQLLPQGTSDSIPMSWGVESSTGAAARGQLAKGKRVGVIAILQVMGCPTASVSWAQPVLGIWTCKRGHRNVASEASWQKSFGNQLLEEQFATLHVKLIWGLELSNIAPSADLRGDSGWAPPPAEGCVRVGPETQVHKHNLRESG